jgi:hypothetical protein
MSPHLKAAQAYASTAATDLRMAQAEPTPVVRAALLAMARERLSLALGELDAAIEDSGPVSAE